MASTAPALLCLILAAAPDAAPPVGPDPTRRCLVCHSVAVAEHLHDWDRSVHAKAGVTCVSCHVTQALLGTPPPGTVGWPSAATTCAACHKAIDTSFRTSRHATQAQQSAPGPSCADCHTRAGGNVLPPERFAERCGRCHPETTAKGDLTISRRAIDVLDLLRRVTLARALVTQELDRKQRRGGAVDADMATFREMSAAVDDLSVEWHRFDFGAVADRCQKLLEGLEELHHRLAEAP